jgi:hypothetical protein
MSDLFSPIILTESWAIGLPLSLYPFKLLEQSPLKPVNALPPQPYITGSLPIVPPPAWLAPDVHPRRFAVIPFPKRPLPTPEPIAYQLPWITITYQPSQVNIINDNQSYGGVNTSPF